MTIRLSRTLNHTLTSQSLLEAESVPLLLFHLLEWLEADYEVEVAAFNQQWLLAQHVASWSQLILEQLEDTSNIVTAAPPTGLWQLQADGMLQFVRPAFSPNTVTNENEALFLRTANLGQTQDKGGGLGRIVTRGRLLTDDYQLTARAQAWIQGFKAEFCWAKQGAAA